MAYFIRRVSKKVDFDRLALKFGKMPNRVGMFWIGPLLAFVGDLNLKVKSWRNLGHVESSIKILIFILILSHTQACVLHTCGFGMCFTFLAFQKGLWSRALYPATSQLVAWSSRRSQLVAVFSRRVDCDELTMVLLVSNFRLHDKKNINTKSIVP